jgi:histone acetyltransferase (RNA polymerase elongator complex component)
MPPGENTAKPFVIPVFIPHAGCSHRCVFCNQKAITRTHVPIPSTAQIQSDIQSYLAYLKPGRKPVQVAFFGGNFLGIDRGEIIRLLHAAAAFVKEGRIDGIRFSTRPDTLTDEAMKILSGFPVSTIEIGAQSMNDAVLSLSRRGHTAQDTVDAAQLVKSGGYELGIQMMVGLPGDNKSSALSSGRAIAALQPDFVRIYPTVVLAGSPLAGWYRQERYAPIPLADAVTLVKNLYLMFQEHQIRVVRMGLQATADLEKDSVLLAGPYHPAFGHLVISEIFRDKAVNILDRAAVGLENVELRVHPKHISAMRGLKNETIHYLKNRYHIRQIDVKGDATMPEGFIGVGPRQPIE